MCMHVLLLCIYVCAWCPWRPVENIGSPGTGITDSYENACGCWKLNPDPLQEQQCHPTKEDLCLINRYNCLLTTSKQDDFENITNVFPSIKARKINLTLTLFWVYVNLIFL